jgi:hypothetical protein
MVCVSAMPRAVRHSTTAPEELRAAPLHQQAEAPSTPQSSQSSQRGNSIGTVGLARPTPTTIQVVNAVVRVPSGVASAHNFLLCVVLITLRKSE